MGLGLTRDGVVGQIVSRSLKLMVWLILKCFTHKSFIPMKCFLNRWAQKRFEFPSKAKMMLSGAISGRTHTFFLHTPNPYDHVVFPTRELNIACQYTPLNRPKASMSCCMSRSLLERLWYTILSSEQDSSESKLALKGTYFTVKLFANGSRFEGGESAEKSLWYRHSSGTYMILNACFCWIKWSRNN